MCFEKFFVNFVSDFAGVLDFRGKEIIEHQFFYGVRDSLKKKQELAGMTGLKSSVLVK
ncbi:MAG: hypothetical protein OXE85_12830 [Roseovarius sp.]|nr:hypothetical protein [Roseovarius sp.]